MLSVCMERESDNANPTQNSVDSHPSLEPPRFGLKTMLALVAAVAVALAIWQAVGPVVGASLLLTCLVVFAHVAGNAIGSTLRDRSSQSNQTRKATANRTVMPDDYAPVTQLSRRAPLGGFMVVMTVLGVIVGAIGGGYGLWRLHPDTATPGSLGVGSLATGTLGGLWAFWSYSLVRVVAGAWWQAHRHGQTKKFP